MRRRAPLLAAACVSCVLATSAAPASAQSEEEEPQAARPWAGSVAPAPVLEGWHEGEAIPPGYARAQRSRLGLVIGGALLFASVYTANIVGVVGSNVVSGQGGENWLAVPGVGPLVLMTQTTSPLGNVFLGIDALAQLGGIAMFAYGLASPKTVLVYEQRDVSFAITPMLGAGRTGVGVVGLF